MAVELLLKNGFSYIGKSKNGLNIFKKTSENMADTCFAMTDSLGNILRGAARHVEHSRFKNTNSTDATWGFTNKDVFQKVTKSGSFKSHEIPMHFYDKTYKARLNAWTNYFGSKNELLDEVFINYAPTARSGKYYSKYLDLAVNKKTNVVSEGRAQVLDAEQCLRHTWLQGKPFTSVSDMYADAAKCGKIIYRM